MTVPATDDWDDEPLRHEPEADEFEVRTGPYDGPLRELVSLAEAKKLDVDAVPLLDLCAQYEAFAASLPVADLTRRTEPLPHAARLTQIRAARLVGRAFRDEASADHRGRPSRDAERIAKVRRWAADLDARERLGRDVFGNGRHRRRADGTVVRIASDADLGEIYARLAMTVARAAPNTPEHVADEMAAKLLADALRGQADRWVPIMAIVARTGLPTGPCYAAILRAALHGAAEGTVTLRQAAPLSPIEVRAAPRENTP